MSKLNTIFPLLSVLLGLAICSDGLSQTDANFTQAAEVNAITMGSPEAASDTHLQALMGDNAEIYAQTMSFPFVHIGDDGSKSFAQSPQDVRISVGRRNYNTRMLSVTELENTGTVAVVRVEFQRFDLQGNATVKGSALWGLRKEDAYWKVSWRQFFGVED